MTCPLAHSGLVALDVSRIKMHGCTPSSSSVPSSHIKTHTRPMDHGCHPSSSHITITRHSDTLQQHVTRLSTHVKLHTPHATPYVRQLSGNTTVDEMISLTSKLNSLHIGIEQSSTMGNVHWSTVCNTQGQRTPLQLARANIGSCSFTVKLPLAQ